MKSASHFIGQMDRCFKNKINIKFNRGVLFENKQKIARLKYDLPSTLLIED